MGIMIVFMCYMYKKDERLRPRLGSGLYLVFLHKIIFIGHIVLERERNSNYELLRNLTTQSLTL